MLDQNKADKLVEIAAEQVAKGIDAQMHRMEEIRDHYDLYQNKTIEVDDDLVNYPFPFFSNLIDNFQAKIDNPPTLSFRMPNARVLSEKVKAAWEQERSSTRSAWNRKDRFEKRQALISGRAVSKVYSSSIGNRYRSHYEPVDIFSFVADPTRGRLEDGSYHGETDIFKTQAALNGGVKNGFYSAGQVVKLMQANNTPADGNAQIVERKYDRLRALGLNVAQLSFAGQKGHLLTEWVMKADEEWFYLLFEPQKKIWVRAEPLEKVFMNGKTCFTSWATNYDEFQFWTKGLSDDVAPVTESMRLLINTAIENEKRRSRPMRIVQGGSLVDVNELQDYVPDNVILTNAGKEPNIVTVETPEIKATIDLVQYLDSTSQAKVGVSDSAVEEKDAKVGIFFGQLQQEADRIGIINKEYSESYADKGYNFFWGLKQNLTVSKQLEMLGRHGVKLQQLDRTELKDVDDVDDILVTGGSRQDELDAVAKERKAKTLSELITAFPDGLNRKWAIEQALRNADFEQDDIEQAQDVEGSVDRDLMEEADQAIRDIMLGKAPHLNNQADVNFLQRIKTFVESELNWIKLDRKGQEVGIDRKVKDQADRLLAYLAAHREIAIRNTARKANRAAMEAQAGLVPPGADEGIDLPAPGKREQRAELAQPFEAPTATPGGSAAASQGITQTLTR